MSLQLGKETGSVMNFVMAGGMQPEPEVGMAATILRWSDRTAGTVIWVTKTQVHVQHDKATRVDKNGASEQQEYTYERDPEGIVRVFRKTKRGWRETGGGSGLLLGERKEYYDYSF